MNTTRIKLHTIHGGLTEAQCNIKLIINALYDVEPSEEVATNAYFALRMVADRIDELLNEIDCLACAYAKMGGELCHE